MDMLPHPALATPCAAVDVVMNPKFAGRSRIAAPHVNEGLQPETLPRRNLNSIVALSFFRQPRQSDITELPAVSGAIGTTRHICLDDPAG
jgi:hypothetical protein